jgi:hypothetical protein
MRNVRPAAGVQQADNLLTLLAFFASAQGVEIASSNTAMARQLR